MFRVPGSAGLDGSRCGPINEQAGIPPEALVTPKRAPCLSAGVNFAPQAGAARWTVRSPGTGWGFVMTVAFFGTPGQW